MKYAIISCVNGAFKVESEWSELSAAKVNFHGKCQTFWNAQDVSRAHIAIMDEQLDVVEGYKECVYHEPTEA